MRWPGRSADPMIREVISQTAGRIELFSVVFPAAFFVLVGAAVIDLLIGEPPESLHPVVWIGRFVGLLKRWFSGVRQRKLAGLLIAVLVPLLSGAIAYLLVAFSSFLWDYAGSLMAILLLKSTISFKSLVGTVNSVGKSIESEPDRAREELLALVGRDRSSLSSGEMRSAAVESLFENLVDSFIAPLFYFFLGSLIGYAPGIGFALFYKAVNTLDSMLGYRTEELQSFGLAAARLDDLLNWFPARISVPFISLASLSFRAPAVAIRDWNETPSPNSGWPMAAAAGGLGVRLAKRGVYVLGGEYELPGSRDLDKAIGLAKRAAAIYLVLSLLLTWSTWF